MAGSRTSAKGMSGPCGAGIVRGPETLKAVFLGEGDDIVQVCIGDGQDGIRGAVVEGHALVLVDDGGAGEDHARHVAYAFIGFCGGEEIGPCAVPDMPGFLEVENRRADAVDVARAACSNAVVDEEPPLVCFNGCGSCAYLCALPPSARAKHERCDPVDRSACGVVGCRRRGYGRGRSDGAAWNRRR